MVKIAGKKYGINSRFDIFQCPIPITVNEAKTKLMPGHGYSGVIVKK